MEPLSTIGIDPGRNSGLVALTDCVIVHAAAATSEHTDPWVKIEALKRAIKALEVPITRGGKVIGSRVVVALESQFIGRNPASAVKVVEAAASWECCARILGCQIVERVAPLTWQALLGLATGDSAYRAKGLRKSLEEIAMQGASPDVQSAVMIAITAQMRRIGWAGDPDRGVDGFAWVLEARRARKMEAQARKAAKRRRTSKRRKDVTH